MTTPTVSVLMSVYNCAAYLREAVDSILAQTYGDFEFIAINDGSSDGSLPILQECAARDARVRLVSRPNTGLIGALNEGIALARGKYIARMDADDRADPTRFAKQVAFLDANAGCVAVGSRVMLMDPYGSPVAVSGHKLEHAEIEQELLTESGWAIVHPAVMMRADAVRSVGGYDKRWKHLEDHDLFLRLAQVGTLANLPEPLLWYRRHYASVNFTKASEQTSLKESLMLEAHARRGRSVPDGWKATPWSPPPADEQFRLWGWAALKAGNVGVARKHAIGTLRRAPASAASWRLLYCAIRGR